MRTRALVATMIFAGLSLGVCAAARAADGEVTYFFSGDFSLPIPTDPDNTKGWMEDAVIEVPLHLTIQDVDVTVDITHTSAFDLYLCLESPSGTKVVLRTSDLAQFFRGGDYSFTTFDDEADIPIEEGRPPFEGSYRPLWSLAAFDGQDAYGPWKFQVYDLYYADVGTFNYFQLAITAPEPVTAAFLLLGLALVGLPLRRG